MGSCWQNDWVQATLIGKIFPEEGTLGRGILPNLTLYLTSLSPMRLGRDTRK